MGCAATRTGRRIEDGPAGTHVRVQVGKRISSTVRDDHGKIVLVFGGPGSKKGRIMDELVEEYGFRIIDVEEIILNHVTIKEEDKTPEEGYQERVKNVENIIRSNPKLVSLNWVLSKVSAEISSMRQDGYKLCLIDFLPKLKFLLETETYSGLCQSEMNKFEEMWPGIFALNLASMEEKSEKTMPSKSEPMLAEEGLDPGFSDEKDYLKTKNRQEFYVENAKEFLNYFRKRERLVTVDISSGQADIISSRVARLFSELGFASTNRIENTLTVFLFDKRDHVEVQEEFSSKNTLGCIFKPWKNLDGKQKARTEVLIVEDRKAESSTKDSDIKEVVFLHPVETTDGFNGAILSKRGQLFKAFSLTEKQVCFFPGLMSSEECGKAWRSRSLRKLVST